MCVCVCLVFTVCVCVFTAVCVHFGWVNAEHKPYSVTLVNDRNPDFELISNRVMDTHCSVSVSLSQPKNIMFSSEGTVKVGDFGLVTVAESDNDVQLLERTKRTGTRVYMSPEQV